jgi:1-hydroxycarotenoid 3,4-desaturase
MSWVFEEAFAAAGLRFRDFVDLQPASTLARHFWTDGSRLDLYADIKQSADAIAAFAGAGEGRRYIEFTERAKRVYETLERPFMRSHCASPVALTRAVGWRGLGNLWRISPFLSLWRVLGRYFRDPRLRQLFARYSTYCGCSPFLAPATLMLIAHVEQKGVWLVRGGMFELAQALTAAARSCGVEFRFDAEVTSIITRSGRTAGVKLQTGEEVLADAVVVTADSAAISHRLFGTDTARAVTDMRSWKRSLSAMTWMTNASANDFPLLHHNVFFSSDYRREFDDIFKHSRMPTEPTVYICAQDRSSENAAMPNAPECMFVLINAPANGDTHPYDREETKTCETRTLQLLERCGLNLQLAKTSTHVTTPADFNRLFPATGGALYGPPAHGSMGSFKRPGSKTRLPGLYLAGGSTHPGPGVPMAALSGRLAAESLLQDFASTASSHTTAMPGGMSTR